MERTTGTRRSQRALRWLGVIVGLSTLVSAGAAPVVAGLRAPGLAAVGSAPASVSLAATALLAPGLRAEMAVDPVLRLAVLAALLGEVGRTPAAPAAPAVKPKPAPKPTAAAAPVYRGRNHVWSRAFGLNRSVVWFSCSRSRPPDYYVYRWGCAGRGNVYLFAHAGGPFRRLHDIYVSGRLRKGMEVVYGDGNGRIHRFRVAWWRVVLPTNGDFAWAAQSRPSMTLQTCVGSNDRYRLVVRLYEVR